MAGIHSSTGTEEMEVPVYLQSMNPKRQTVYFRNRSSLFCFPPLISLLSFTYEPENLRCGRREVELFPAVG